ncbi:unnamed protein product [Coffea canephora]|uniref:Protein kinase domain-containing protein n=1 Tax=Coffea canephora TaxID=49390 RepID=A0A068UCN6_COFCA|nr:unnamed protein product [Coffea canephora]
MICMISCDLSSTMQIIMAVMGVALVRPYGCCIDLKHSLQYDISLSHSFPCCLTLLEAWHILMNNLRLKIAHRDIMATNVLLEKDLNAKISDFGLAKLMKSYDLYYKLFQQRLMAHEYAMKGYLTDKADVYRFGVVAQEIFIGKRTQTLDWFRYSMWQRDVLQERGNLLELVDPSLGSSYNTDEALRMLNLAL